MCGCVPYVCVFVCVCLQTNGWKQAAAFVLIILFVVSVGQLALAANITKLPKETLGKLVSHTHAHTQTRRTHPSRPAHTHSLRTCTQQSACCAFMSGGLDISHVCVYVYIIYPEWFSNPANFESNELPPGLENWDPISYFSTAAPIFSAVLGVNVTHEIGHRIAVSGS